MSERPDQPAATTPQRRWCDCPTCQAWFAENHDAAIHAAASVGVERGLTTNQALAAYMRDRHAEHA